MSNDDPDATIRRWFEPMVAVLRAGASSEAADVARVDTPATVLIVDDDLDVRHLIKLSLRRAANLEVVAEAGDGDEGVQKAVEHQPDVVLLDLMMPGADGWKAAPQIVARSPRSMIVALSALQADQEAERLIRAGAFAYVEKSEIGADFAKGLQALLEEFRRVLSGEDLLPPSGRG